MSFSRKPRLVAQFARASALALLLASRAASQGNPLPDRQPRSLYDIGHSPNWPHIGSPPTKESPPSRAQAWPDERKSFDEALDALKRGWSGEVPTTAADLKYRVNQYEDVVRTATAAGGYGNLVLADTARRLDLALLSYYVILHSQDHAAVAEILNDHRARLLDCPATAEMIAEELKISAPPGKWHLSEKREDLERVLRSNGSSISREVGRTMMYPPGPGKLINQRDVNFLLIKLTYDEEEEVSTLACIMEFLKRGGSPNEPGSFQRVIDMNRERFPFAPTGVTGPWGQVGALIDRAQKWDGKPIPFTLVAGYDESPSWMK
jgi:hypothetical protein